MADGDSSDSGIQWTEYGPSDKGTWMADSNSRKGIGAWDNQMTVGRDVAMNAASREEKGIRAYDPKDPSTKDQWFYDKGQWWHYADNVPEKYSNARIDVFKGRYDGVPDSGSNEAPVTGMPSHLDFGGGGEPAEAAQKEDYEAYAKSIRQTAPPPEKSLVQTYFDKYPEEKLQQGDLIKKMHDAYAPGMPLEEFTKAATTPGGIQTIKDYLERQKDRIDQVKDRFPEWKNIPDDKLSEMIYKRKVETGDIDPTKLTLQEFKWRMKPPRDAWNQGMRFLTELWEQAGPKTQAEFLKMRSGLTQEQLSQAEPAARNLLAQAYPGSKEKTGDGSLDSIYRKYAAMKPEERERQFFKAYNASHQGPTTYEEDLAKEPLDKLGNRLDAAFTVIDQKAQLDKVVKDSETLITELDSAHEGNLPENQQKTLDMILQAPPQALINLVPGIGQFGLFGSFYRDNQQAIKKANPLLSDKEVSDRAKDATINQLALTETIGMIFHLGGGQIAASITNKVLKGALKLGAGTAGGAGAFSANQVIQNLASGRDPRFGLGEAIGTGAVFGLSGAGIGLTVEGLAGAFKASPEVRRSMGISSDIVSATPEEANKILAGDPTAEVNKKATANAVDMILSAAQQRQEERRIMTGRLTVSEVEALESDPAYRRAREKDILAGRSPKERGYEPVPDIVPEEPLTAREGTIETPKIEGQVKTPAQEGFAKAQALRDKGDLDGAAKKINEALASASSEEQKAISKNGSEILKAITKKGQRLEQIEGAKAYFGIAKTVPPKAEEAPEGKGVEISKAGPREVKRGFGSLGVMPEVKWLEEGDPEALGEEAAKLVRKGAMAAGASKPERTSAMEIEPGVGSLGAVALNPWQQSRAAVNLLRAQDMWRNSWDWVSRNFAPQRRGQQASDTAALVIKTSGWKPFIHSALNAIADDLRLNDYLRNGTHSDRRDAFWGKFSDPEKADMQTAREHGQKVNDPVANALFDFYREGYDWLEEQLRGAGVKMGHVSDYFHHAFKDPSGRIDQFIHEWEHKFAQPGFSKTRSYPTLEDALAAGLKPRSYSPERNFIAYTASAVNALRQVQALQEMENEGLAVRTTEAKEEGLKVPDGWHLLTGPDKISRYVSDGAYGVVSNAFDTKSIYSTMGGPFAGFFRFLKLPTGLKLSWSLFHAMHVTTIAATESLTTAQERLVRGVGKPSDFVKAIGDVASFGISKAVTSTMKYGRLVDALEGKASWDKLTAAEKSDMRDLMEMGIVPHISAERQRAFANFIFQNKGLAHAVDWLGNGYRIATCEPYQKFLFGKVIPSLKVAAALARRDTLLMKYGERLKGEDMNIVRAREYAKINRDIEGRFGEMLYDNLFWKRMWKQIGLAVPLSLGWNLGFWRVYGDGIIDFTRDAANLDRLASRWKKDPSDVLTNRLLYATNYTALSILTNGVMTYALTGAIKNAADFFFPRIGQKKNGEDERVRTPYWTGEWASMTEHLKEAQAKNANPVAAPIIALSEYFGNKLNPGLAAVWHYFLNKDFSGRTIVDWKGDDQTKKLTDSVMYFLHDLFVPISAEQMSDIHGVPTELNQKVWGAMGFGPAAGWASRTELENKIMAQMLHRDMTQEEAARYDAKERFQYALTSGDNELREKSLQELHSLGASKRMIDDAVKNARIPPAHRAFHALGTERQLDLMRQMSPEELSEYWPLATHEAKVEFQHQEPQG